MKLIARNNGPRSKEGGDQLTFSKKHLLKGKEYEVISWAYQDKQSGLWIESKEELKFNPREYKYMIKVINEDGILHDYWNDYFLSTQEIREEKLNQIFN